MTAEDWLYQADQLIAIRASLLMEDIMSEETDMLNIVIGQVEAEAGAEWVREQRTS
jgi:hypothetical protein